MNRSNGHEQMSTEQTANLLGISTPAVCRAIREGRIEATKRGRQWSITVADAKRYRPKGTRIDLNR